MLELVGSGIRLLQIALDRILLLVVDGITNILVEGIHYLESFLEPMRYPEVSTTGIQRSTPVLPTATSKIE